MEIIPINPKAGLYEIESERRERTYMLDSRRVSCSHCEQPFDNSRFPKGNPGHYICRLCRNAYNRRRYYERIAGKYSQAGMWRRTPHASRPARPVDLHWAAGFLEGEGCFGGQRRTNEGSLLLRVDAGQTCREPLDKLQSILGGKVSIVKNRKDFKPHWKQQYRWTANGPRAAGVMMTLYSLLSPRRQEKIAALLSARRSQPGGK